MSREWDAPVYDRIADPQARWGAAVVDRAPLGGDELVLDAGCGSGRVTELLAARLSSGRVVALDASTSMIAEARRRLAGVGHRAMFVVADLAAPLPLPPRLDAVVSTATFHWIADHDALFRHLAAVLRDGGRLVAQCGGEGNVERVARAVRELGGAWGESTTFAGVDETARRLARAGFVDVDCWLEPAPTAFDSDEALVEYLRTIVLRLVLERLPAERRATFPAEVAARLPARELDYVRLNIAATRSRRGAT
jgi:trans-aconitate 2-methyltransferase